MFADVEKFIHNVTGEAVKAAKADEVKLASDVKDEVAKGKAAVESAIVSAEPGVKAAAEKAVGDLEQAVLALIAAHLG
jgi:hypothetical protein